MRLIDADKLEFRKFAGRVQGETEKNIYGAGWNDAIDAIIDNEPTVEERPHGKWIKEDKPFGGFGDFVLVNTCSICGESIVYHGENANFCPNCGADMRGGQDNDSN